MYPNRRVLVADDTEEYLAMYAEALTASGYLVTQCHNGREALQALQKEAYDAVVSDIQMPDMDGLGLLTAVRARDLDLPVILVTGSPSMHTALEAIQKGALEYLIKPVALKKLVDVVGRAVKLGALARLKREALRSMGFEQFVGDRAGLEASFGRAVAGTWIAYQPIVNASDGRVYGHESLVRTAERVFPNPGSLFDAAERLGRLPELGRTIRNTVAQFLTREFLAGEVFVNLHPHDLVDEMLFDPKAPLSAFASRVILEVTERASLDDVSNLADRVGALRKLGYRIALDDLGAGYAGLNSLTSLTPDVVKFDMALIRGLDRDPVKRKLVTSMANVCHELGIKVVAEGIETQEERVASIEAGCDLLQGFLIGRPTSLAE
jgi:EAL domain-containing protein (putative c-di-GMP-specific phosphodiesterase class I)